MSMVWMIDTCTWQDGNSHVTVAATGDHEAVRCAT